MKADAHPSNVAATLGVGVKVPAALWAGIGLSLFGAALLAAAGLIFTARSRVDRRGGSESSLG